MKIILSRKGFDTSSGGCPNPIFPGGDMLALPIPDSRSRIKYKDIHFNDHSLGSIVNHLTKGKHKPNHKAHLDPDLIRSMYPREKGWKPVLGQTGSAQGHLSLQKIETGDVFLFFGLFRNVERHQRKWRFVPGSKPKHVLWGWLQVGLIKAIDELKENELKWAHYHPHMHGNPDVYNTLYIASDKLSLSEQSIGASGSGVFSGFQSELCLTARDSSKPSFWQLPAWFFPDNKTPLTYHNKMARWTLKDERCYLQSVARGQEFVLHADEYPQACRWLSQLIKRYT